MNKKLYISPEFEWLEIDMIEDVLTVSNPVINDDDFDMGNGDDMFGDGDDYEGGGAAGDGGGGLGGGADAGEDWW